MNVLSLFDGMSCGMIALDRLGIKVDNYFASEIDKNAIKVSKANWPLIKHIGDVTKVSYRDGVLYTGSGSFEVNIDLVIGGSPCQDFSPLRAMGQHGRSGQGLEGSKSGLFYEFLRIKNECNPPHWLLENVRMKQDSKKKLDSYLGVDGKLINSSTVSFQKRSRYYWSNLDFKEPVDRGISFQSYKEGGNLSAYKVNKTPSRIRMWNNGNGDNSNGACANVTHLDKVYCLTTKQDRCPNSGLVEYEDFCRFLTQRELEAAQTVPTGYTDCLSFNQAQAVLGNGWTVDVIAHILKGINIDEEREEDSSKVFRHHDRSTVSSLDQISATL